MIRVAVVVQTREMLNEANKGQVKKVKIWCKYVEDVVKYKRLYTAPTYKVIDTQVEIQYVPKIDETYEEGA